MRSGKGLVDFLSDLTGHEPNWVVFPKEDGDTCPDFSTATFSGLYSETLAALMPINVDGTEEKHFTIEVSSTGIKICVFCHIEDAPASAREYRNG